MKVQTKRAFKSYFCHQKIIKKQKGALNFLQPEVKMCRGFYIPYFKINVPSFCWPLFFEEYLNPQVRINKMVNEHTVDYQPSPSELTSRIHPFIFLKAHKGFISPEYFSQKSFKFMVLRLLANAFMSQKLNLFIHTHAPSKPLPQAEENYLFLQNSGF